MKTPKCTPLLTHDEVSQIFADGPLYEQASFFILEKNATYNTSRERGSFLEEAQYIKDKFQSGHTIIVRNLEYFNTLIRKTCAELGRDVDVHMYLVPHNGKDSFPFHTDDRDVHIHMVYGEKTFQLKGKNQVINHYLKANDTLYIPQGTFHRALATGASCLLSFGVNTRPYYAVPGGIGLNDLHTNQVNL